MFAALPTDTIRELAESNGVCVRPIVHEVVDTSTGQVRLVPTPCGATMAAKCLPCAQKARALRMQQCREGWHLDEEPERDTPAPAEDRGDEHKETGTRRVRSTRRRQDLPDLPRFPVDQRTIGHAFIAPSGRTYRPSMFVTFTLPSYGRVGPDGTPLNPSTYNYRRAALDALHFPRLIDRVWQNMRRATGYQVQYFAAVEAQRRLAPHLHAAIRGAIPRELLRAVAQATYHQVWWPDHSEPVYTGTNVPVWTDELGFVDPETGAKLPTWGEALDALDIDPDARPAHTVRLGKQLDMQGIIATEGDADRRVAYLTKYLAKSFTEVLGDSDELTNRQRAHVRRLAAELKYLPCAPRCWNWLRFGVQPDMATPDATPGECPGKAHRQDALGCGGRRVLVSRKWTGKTLKGHKADRAEVVRQTLIAAGLDVPQLESISADVKRDDGHQRFEWRVWDPLDSTVPVYRQVMVRALAERMRWRADYEKAKAACSPATGPPRPPDNQPLELRAVPVKGERSSSRSDTKCP